MNFKSPLAKARGLGSAQQGTHHWWMQRVTAIALIPLSLWFAIAIASSADASYEQITDWIASPLNTLLLLSFIIAGLYHAMLGVQVVIEDYIQTSWLKIGSILIMKLFLLLLMLAASLATLHIVFSR